MNGRAAILLAAAGLPGGRVFRCVCKQRIRWAVNDHIDIEP